MDYYPTYSQREGLQPPKPKPYVEGWEFYYEIETPAATYPVSLAEAKAFARIDPTGDATADTENDDIVTELIIAATGVFEDQTGRALVLQTWKAFLDASPCSQHLQLSKGRIDSVSSIKGYADDGSSETLDSGSYLVDNENGRIGLINSGAWPTSTRGFKGFEVEYVAGYSTVPEEAKTAIKQIVSHWFEHRESVIDLTFNTVPFSTKPLINRLTVGRI